METGNIERAFGLANAAMMSLTKRQPILINRVALAAWLVLLNASPTMTHAHSLTQKDGSFRVRNQNEFRSAPVRHCHVLLFGRFESPPILFLVGDDRNQSPESGNSSVTVGDLQQADPGHDDLLDSALLATASLDMATCTATILCRTGSDAPATPNWLGGLTRSGRLRI